MPQEYVIGRHSGSIVKVPTDKEGVSGRHVKITVTDSGEWLLEDLQSANGTFLRDDTGTFTRIFTKEIKEYDIIRLGPDGANGFVFMAHRVIAPEDSYAYEFRQLRRQARGQLEKEKKKEKKIEINGWISKVSGLAAMGLCSLAGSVAGLSVSPNTRYMLIACAPVLVGLIFSGDAKALKDLRKKREKLFLCPKCGKPLAEFDIEQGQCSRCKAK